MSRRAAGGRLLAADVGGTRTTMALAASASTVLAQHVYASQSFQGLEDIVADFLARPESRAQAGAIAAACFSVAGPVAHDASILTNLGWRVDGAAIARRFGWPAARIINDFSAVGHGIARLREDEMLTLQAGRPEPAGTRLVIGAGTGLGVGLLTWQDGEHAVHASEAGHADFAPVNEAQDALLAYLRRSFERVSYERVVSGPGLMRIFSFLQDSGAGVPSRPLQEAARLNADMAEVIAEFALARRDPLAVRALDLFVSAYGAFAGNMALAMLARGGVYIAGGIAPRIAAKLSDGVFTRAFNSKGRFRDLLETIPVRVVMNPQVGLLGALREAERLRG